jgi:hypothetical protein
MIHDLNALHEDTYEALSELGDLTRAGVPDRSKLATVRWKLTSSTVKRLRLLELRIYPALLPIASPAERIALEQLATERRERRQLSADHVARWTLEHAITDWEGYRRASVAITSGALKRLSREREVLVPMIKRLEPAFRGLRAGARG